MARHLEVSAWLKVLFVRKGDFLISLPANQMLWDRRTCQPASSWDLWWIVCIELSDKYGYMKTCTGDPPFRIVDIPLIMTLIINIISVWDLSRVKSSFVSFKTNKAVYLQPIETAFTRSWAGKRESYPLKLSMICSVHKTLYRSVTSWSPSLKMRIQPFSFSPCPSQQLHLLFSLQLCILPVTGENRIDELIRSRGSSYVNYVKHCQSNADHLGTKHICGQC